MIVVYAGRRPSGSGGDFPDAHAPLVRTQLSSMIAGLRPRLVVGSAAAGADLLVLSVALELADKFGIRCRVVTAGKKGDFQESSVADKGSGWVALYERVLSDTRHVHLIERPVPSDDDGYTQVLKYVQQQAKELRKPDDEPIVGIRVGPNQARPGLDHTADFAEGLYRENYPVLNVRTDLDRFPDAFVAMPFATKEIPSRKWRAYESDVSYERIFVPALIAAGFTPRRVDNDNFTEIIDSAMIRPLGDAKLVVGDLTTGNPNVFWELGVRHAWKRHGTALVRLEKTPVPFDLGRIPVHEYYRSESSVNDSELVRSLESLVEPFRAQANAAAEECDSPVFAHLPDLKPTFLPPSRDPAKYGRIDRLEREIGTAGTLRHADELIALSDKVNQDQSLSNETKERLQGGIAAALISMDHLDNARTLLEPLAAADFQRQNLALQQNYAHTLIRGTNGNLDDDLREAEAILTALLDKQPDAKPSELLGLLGSAAKVMAERALERDDLERVAANARAAAETYEKGFKADPRNYYPGVNVVALRRLLGQRWDPNDKDLKHVREILPIVKFMTCNSIENGGASIWAHLTDAELDLHQYLLDNPDPTAPSAPPELVRTFNMLNRLTRDQRNARRSFGRQLRLMRDAGDPAPLLDQLIAKLEA